MSEIAEQKRFIFSQDEKYASSIDFSSLVTFSTSNISGERDSLFTTLIVDPKKARSSRSQSAGEDKTHRDLKDAIVFTRTLGNGTLTSCHSELR